MLTFRQDLSSSSFSLKIELNSFSCDQSSFIIKCFSISSPKFENLISSRLGILYTSHKEENKLFLYHSIFPTNNGCIIRYVFSNYTILTYNYIIANLNTTYNFSTCANKDIITNHCTPFSWIFMTY